MRSKELSVELRDRIVLLHRSGEVYQHSAVLKIPKNIVASIILKLKKFGTKRLLLELATQPNCSIGEEDPWSER
jgi:hypothetical protein